MSRIFVSYRRQDSLLMTGRIYDKLESVFGADKVFRDLDDIGAGEDFRAKLAKEIEKTDILLVVIGPKWENIADANGNRRLDSPNDFVRLEVESCLKRADKIVIPVLVENTPMPAPANLPESLRELSFRNAVSVRPDPDFQHDIQKLIRQIQDIEQKSLPFYRKKSFLLWSGLIAFFLLIAFIANIWNNSATPALITETAPIIIPITETVTPNIRVTDTAIVYFATATVSAPTLTNTPSRPIRIGVIHIPKNEFDDVLIRLQFLGYVAEWIGVNSDYAVLSQYDIIYLPIGWAFQKAVIEEHALQYRRFVEEGGGLIVEQPNFASILTPNLLPYKLTFKLNLYDPNETPPRVINEHEIVKDVPLSELPGPGNVISASDENWIIITASAQSNIPTLLVADYGKGKIAVFGTSVSPNKQKVRYQVGDKFIKQLVAWVNQ